MKKWILMASVMLAAGSFTACGEDEPNEPVGDATDGDGDTDGGDDGDTTPADTCFESDSANPGFGIEVNRADGGGDADLDGVCDDTEAGLTNSDGVACNTLEDCDSDNITDAGELFYRDDRFDSIGFATSPISANTDNAGADDLEEFQEGLDPTNPNDNIDTSLDTEKFDGDAYSYVSGIGIAGADCCFSNLDADAAIDNDLAALLTSLSSLGSLLGDIDLSPAGIAALIAPIIEEGTLTLIFEHSNVPVDIEEGQSGNVSVQPYLGSLVGETPATLAVRQAGDGEYFLDETVGDPFSAIINGGQFLVNDGTLNLALDLSAIAGDLLGGAELLVDLDVKKLRIRGDVSEQTKADITDALGVATATNLEVGGALPIDKVATLVNDLLGECYPAGFELLSIDEESNPDRVKLACAATIPDVANPDALGGLCGDVGELLGQVCGLLDTIIGANLSVDTDDDGKADGLALGLLLELSGAADIRTPVVE